MWRRILHAVFFLLLRSPSVLAGVCTYDCSDCESPWYENHFDRCSDRTSREPPFFFKAYNCHPFGGGEQVIRDEESCMDVLGRGQHRKTHHDLGGDIYASFDADNGCKLNAKHVKMFGLGWVQSEVCFGLVPAGMQLATCLGSVVLGVIVAVAAHRYENKHISHFISNMPANHFHAVFGPGSRKVAMHSIAGMWRQRGVLFYRFNQVVANVWFPMALMWIVSPALILPLWVLLYWLPPYFTVGLEVLTQPRHAITPPHTSLLGIGLKHRGATIEFLYSLLRPIIFLCIIYVTMSLIVYKVHRDDSNDAYWAQWLGAWVLNPQGFWRTEEEGFWGDIVLFFSIGVTAMGTLLHILLTILPVVKSMGWTNDKCCIITLDEDEALHKEVLELANKVCLAARADDTVDEDRVGALKVETVSPFGVASAVFLAWMDLVAYLYKIYVFLEDGRYYLAGIIIVALVESAMTLILGNHLLKACRAMRRVSVTGVETAHFLACCQWDDGLAGIPCLLVTVYGLPLVSINTPVRCVSSMIFLLSGTKALAQYLLDVTDADMYSVTALNGSYNAVTGDGAWIDDNTELLME